ncbi:Sexual development regulator VELC [Lachnellula hyalina]|uniref:Sexual development regulator VELC n=1 Tax=Lachnellula hyalina TaxID=1316788 RepID=A0A8H8TZS9_9HELO|nr:Sexual development regulator VELC [Lachnellula hyalina]TVY28509.1 Sexual development regulator VELC [Lachnellula hyalina]
MSKSEPTRAGAAPAPHSYPYPPRTTEGGNPRAPPLILPPMSSLLQRNERMEPELHNPYSSRRFSDRNHPLWISESDPNAPYPAQPILVPNHPQNQSNLGHNPDQRPPQPQARQIRRIVQRRGYDVPKGDTTPEIISPVSNPHPWISQPPSQSASPFQQQMALSPAGPAPAPTQSPTSRSMPISGLLSGSPSPEMRRPPPNYSIRMRQEPIAARACGFGERDRRVIDPPPILQMMIEDPNSTPGEISALLRQPSAVMHCTLWDPVANKDDSAMPGTTDKRQQRRLMGTLVSSPFVGQDEHNVEGCFFTFPDLSVRTPGTYSLRFSLMILDVTRMIPGEKVPVRCLAFSQAFHVYNAKDFGGMRASTELTKRLKHQGCLISVKKGNAKSSGGAHESDGDDDDDDNEDLGEKKPAKRPKR